MNAQKLQEKRFEKTIQFLKKVQPNCKTILDLGIENALSARLSNLGYDIHNTKGEDLDLNPESLLEYPKVDTVTAFEILEHLVSPYPVLKNIPSNNLVVTVPMSLWFSEPYRNKNDEFDMHYHEFVDWQFEMLLNKAGWEIKYSEKWTAPTYQIGVRPILRFFYPRFLAIHAVRK